MTDEPKREDWPQCGGDDEIRWWRPDWTSALTAVGRGWVVALITLVVLTLIPVAAIFLSGLEVALILLFIKVAVLMGGAAVSLAIYIFKRAVSLRREPFCIFCGYNLSGLPDHHRCPECGREYTHRMIEEYRRDPGWFVQRWKLRQQQPQDQAGVDVPPDAPRRRSRDGT